MKYIMFEVRLGRGSKKKVPVIFDEFLVHADVAQRLAPLGGKVKMKPVSAGFIDLTAKKTYGRSASLNLGIEIGDCEIIERMDYMHGVEHPQVASLIDSAVAKAQAIVAKMKSPASNQDPAVCMVCGVGDKRPEVPWHTIYGCHFDCVEEYERLAEEGQPQLAPPELIPDLMAAAAQSLAESRTVKAGTLAHAFTHSVALPSVTPEQRLPRAVTRTLLARCQVACTLLRAYPPSHPTFRRAHWAAKQGMGKHPHLSQAWLFHAYQVATMSDWYDHRDKMECLTLINMAQTIDPRNELRSKVYTVNIQHGTVTTHSLSESKNILSN